MIAGQLIDPRRRRGQRAVPTPSASPSIAEVEALATALGLDLAVVQSAIDAAGQGRSQVLDLGPLGSSRWSRPSQTLITLGLLPEHRRPVGDAAGAWSPTESGIGFVDARSAGRSPRPSTTDAPATSIAVNYGSREHQLRPGQSSTSRPAIPSSCIRPRSVQRTPWTVTKETNQPLEKMPGAGHARSSSTTPRRIVQALGRTPDGTGWTVYAIETNGNAVFSDAVLPFEPVAIGLDSSPSCRTSTASRSSPSPRTVRWRPSTSASSPSRGASWASSSGP